MNTYARIIAACVAAAVLAACAGHKNSSPLPPALKQSAKVQFTIRVPKAGTKIVGRHGDYISPATQAVQINAQAFNVSPSSSNCTSDTTSVTCTFRVDAPNLGTAYFTVTTYDKPLDANGQVQGNQLSTGSTSANIVAGTANTVKVTTNGVPAQGTFSIPNLTPTMGTAITMPVTFNVQDADGYTIVGAYSQWLSFSEVDATSSYGTTFSVNGDPTSALIIKSSDTVTMTYSGHLVGKTTITLMAGSKALDSLVFDPQPGFGPETTVDTPLDHGQAFRDQGAPVTTYFTEPAKHSFGTMQAGTGVVEFATPSGGAPGHLMHSFIPEGVAFTEDNGYIGSIGINNGAIAISDKQMPTASPNPGFYQVAQFGLSGTQAFTEYNAGTVAEYVNEGDPLAGGKGMVLVEYPTGQPGSTPAGIVATQSGFLFADPGANAIAFLNSTTNAFTYYPVPTAGAHPTDVATDQNNNLWFTEPGANKIGKMDSSNAITEYPCNGSPIAIVGQYTTLAVLTSAGNIEIYNASDGTYKEYVPPASSSGQVVGIGDGGLGDVIVLRSNGSTGSISDFYYE